MNYAFYLILLIACFIFRLLACQVDVGFGGILDGPFVCGVLRYCWLVPGFVIVEPNSAHVEKVDY